MKPKTIVFHTKPILGVEEDQIPMIAKCYPIQGGEEEVDLFLLYSMDSALGLPFGKRIRSDDVHWNHPEFLGVDGFYPHQLSRGMDMAVFSEIDSRSWEDVSNAGRA